MQLYAHYFDFDDFTSKNMWVKILEINFRVETNDS